MSNAKYLTKILNADLNIPNRGKKRIWQSALSFLDEEAITKTHLATRPAFFLDKEAITKTRQS
jgi:hypothetical protein